MKVKCRICKTLVEREKAFKVVKNSRNEYYCNEKEYLDMMEEKESRLKFLNLIDDIFGYKVINTTLFKELKEIALSHTYKKMYSYACDNLNDLKGFMNKDFNSEFGRIKYFTTILKNNIKDYEEIEQEIVIEKPNFEMVETLYNSKKKKKSLEDYINELG